MPLQNRVTPWGEIVAVPERGLFTGNRGIIHDPVTRTLLTRRWASKAWLICSCQYQGRRRQVMGGRSWTELFFLDEATALAAGHRPCHVCRREAALAFRAAWAHGNVMGLPKVDVIDKILQEERLDGRSKRMHPLPAAIGDLPDGTMIAAGNQAFAISGRRAFRWSFAGYLPAAHPAGAALLLTPPSTVRALAAGYRPIFHPSIERQG